MCPDCGIVFCGAMLLIAVCALHDRFYFNSKETVLAGITENTRADCFDLRPIPLSNIPVILVLPAFEFLVFQLLSRQLRRFCSNNSVLLIFITVFNCSVKHMSAS